MFLSLHLFLLLQLTVVLSQVEDGEILCSMVACPTEYPPNGSFTSDCRKHDEYNLVGHCCLNASSSSIISIDLSYCNVRYIGSLLQDETPDVLKVNLSGNPHLHMNNDSLTGLTKLFSLTLPQSFKCPGQWQWFNSTWNSWNKTIVEKKQTRCINQSDTCSLLYNKYNCNCDEVVSEEEVNLGKNLLVTLEEMLPGTLRTSSSFVVLCSSDTCPGEHSKCVNNGPGQFLCLCEEGWDGYKCLRKKNSNVVLVMVPATFGTTVVLSAILWCTERKYVT